MTAIYRRQSMAHLYEKLKAQDDEDDMAWLAQFSLVEKACDPRSHTSPSPYSSVSSVSSSTSGSSLANNRHSSVISDSSDDYTSSDSDSDVDEAKSGVPGHEQMLCQSLLFQPHDLIGEAESSCTSTLEHDAPSSPSPVYSPSSSSVPPRDSLPLPPSSPVIPVRTVRLKQCSSLNHASPTWQDEQADTESDGGAGDDNYTPSSYARKRPHSARSTAGLETRATEAFPQAKRSRRAPLSRNVQALPGAIQDFSKGDPWACPYCSWVQHNHRTPDLKRHVQTHTRLQRPAQWICCGVPLSDARRYQLPEGSQPYDIQGKMMIGGCGREFSRRDALKRHLDNNRITCVGDMDAFATSYD